MKPHKKEPQQNVQLEAQKEQRLAALFNKCMQLMNACRQNQAKTCS